MSPEGYQQKGSSFCTKNTDIVCCQPQAALRGASWLTRSLRQLGPKSPHRVPGWGLLGTAAGRGQPSCTAAPFRSVDIAMGQRRALFVLSHQPARLALVHRFLTAALHRALQDAHEPLSHPQASQVASRLEQSLTGGPQTQATIKPQVSPNSSRSSHSLISAATPRFRFSFWNQTNSVTVPGLCTHSHIFLPQKHHLQPSSCSPGYQQRQETAEKEAG